MMLGTIFAKSTRIYNFVNKFERSLVNILTIPFQPILELETGVTT